MVRFAPSLLKATFVASLLFSPPSWAINAIDPARTTLSINEQDQVLLIEVKEADGSVTKRTEPLIRVKKGEKFFHWTIPENVERWGRQGHIDRGEIDYLSKPTGDRQAYGAGFYTSADPLDSAGFGAKAIMMEAPEDFYLVGTSFKSPNEAEVKATYDALRQKNILGARANTNWRVFWDERTVRNVRPLDSQIILDFYEKAGSGLSIGSLEGLAGRFGLKPHPAYDQALPGFSRLLSRQPVTETELADIVTKIYGRTGMYLALRNALADKISSSTLQEYLLPFLGREEAHRGQSLIYIDQLTGGVKNSAALRKFHASVAAFLEGKPLSADQREELKDLFFGGDMRGNYGPFDSAELKTETPLLRKIKEEYAPEIRERFRARLENSESAGGSEWMRRARELGVRLSELVPGERDPGGNLTDRLIRGEVPDLKKGLNPFGQNLADSFAFIDHFDLARAVAQGHPEPWRLYDEPGSKPLLERWREGAGTLSATGDVIKTHEALLGRPSEFRGTRVVAGGDVRLPGDDFGYTRVTEEQLRALKENPYVKIYLKDDPWPQHPGRKSYLVRYEYPSAATYEQLREKLSANLNRALDEAKRAGKLASEASPEFRKLTQEIIAELWKGASTESDPIARYRAHVSVHPFTDYNGRLSRLYYQAEMGKPLVMPQWDLDLYSHPLTLAAHRDKGDHAYRKIVNALSEAQKANPQFPRFYETPELYETLLDLPPERNGKARARHLAELKTFLKGPEAGEMIRKKETTELQWRLWDLEGRGWARLPESERASVLRKWMLGGFTPEFTDQKLFKQVLDESVKLARGKSAAQAARWWLQLGSGIDPAHGGVLHTFLKNLPEELKKSFQKEWVKGQTIVNLPMGADARAQVYAGAKEALTQGTPAERSSWAKFFLKQHIANPADPKKPYAEILKLIHETKGDDLLKAMEELLPLPGYPFGGQLRELALLLPQEKLASLSEPLFKSLAGIPSNEVLAFARGALIGAREPLAAQIVTKLVEGRMHEKLLDHPEARALFLRHLNKLPANTSARLKMRPLLGRAAPSLQSFADRKEWKNFIDLMHEMDLTTLKATDEAALKSGIKRFRAEASGNGLAADILEAKLLKDPSAVKAAETKILRVLAENLAEPSFADTFILFSRNRGLEPFVSLLPDAIKKGDAALRRLILASPAKALSGQSLPKATVEAVVAAIRSAPASDILPLATYFTPGGGIDGVEDTFLAESFRRLGSDEQLAFLEERKYQGYRNSWPLIEETVKSPDPRVQSALIKDLVVSGEHHEEHLNFLRRLILKGEGSLLDKPLPPDWLHSATAYLRGRSDAESEKILKVWLEKLRTLTKAAPKTEREARTAAEIIAFVYDFQTPAENLEMIYRALENMPGADVPKGARGYLELTATYALQDVSELVGPEDLDFPRLHEIFRKTKNGEVLRILTASIYNEPDSPLKFRVMLDALRFGTMHVQHDASNYLSLAVNDKASPLTEAQKAELRKTFAALLDAEHAKSAAEWEAFGETRTYRDLPYLGRSVGFDAADHIRSLEARGRPIAAGAQGVTCSFHFDRIKLK